MDILKKQYLRKKNLLASRFRLASVGILIKERELVVGKLGWHGYFDTGFERNISFKIPCACFLNFFEIATVY